MVLVSVGESSVLEVNFDLSTINQPELLQEVHTSTYLIRHLVVNIFTAEASNEPNNTKSHGNHRHDTATPC